MQSKCLKGICCIFWFQVWSRGSLSCLFLLLFQERSASQPSRQHRPSVTLSRRYLEVEKIYSVSSPVPSTRLVKHFRDILILPATVTFSSRRHLIHAGSVLQDDPGCCSEDRLPQTSTATLHFLPCPAGGANQDECQRRKLLNLSHGHTQADQKQGEAFTGASRSDFITCDSRLKFLANECVARRSTSMRFREERTQWKSTGSMVETLMLMSPSCI